MPEATFRTNLVLLKPAATINMAAIMMPLALLKQPKTVCASMQPVIKNAIIEVMAVVARESFPHTKLITVSTLMTRQIVS